MMMNKEQQIKEWFENNKQSIESEIKIRIKRFNSDWNFAKDYYYFNKCLFLFKDNKMNYIDPYVFILKCFTYLKYYYKIKTKSLICTLEDMLIKKNRDYGSSFDKSVNKFGWVYVAIELDKKKNRLHSLLKNKEKPNYESVEDTLLDIAGYCVLSLIYLENKELSND